MFFRRHLFLGSQKLATLNNKTTLFFVNSDHLGSSSILADATGTIAELTDYRPYGALVFEQTTTATGNKYKFTGKETDPETTLQYFGAMYYENTLGRFSTVDPILLDLGNPDEFKEKTQRTLSFHLATPQNLNSYSYTLNNPLRYTDPDGEIIPLILLAWGAVELGLSAYDAFDTARTVTNPNASVQEKALSGGLFLFGLAAPGGGYNQLFKTSLKTTNDIIEHVARGTKGGGGHLLNEVLSRGKEVTNLRFIGNVGVTVGTVKGKGFTTFFPKNWSREDLKGALNFLEQNHNIVFREGDGATRMYLQSTKPYKDVYLEGFLDAKQELKSFYPSYHLNQ